MLKTLSPWIGVVVVASAIVVLALGLPGSETEEAEGFVVVMSMTETSPRELVIEDPGLTSDLPGRTTRPRVVCLENGVRVNTCSPYWQSSDPEVVSVDEKTGVVRFNAPGQATISVYWSKEERDTVLHGSFETLSKQPKTPPLSPNTKTV